MTRHRVTFYPKEKRTKRKIFLLILIAFLIIFSSLILIKSTGRDYAKEYKAKKPVFGENQDFFGNLLGTSTIVVFTILIVTGIFVWFMSSVGRRL